MADTKTKDQVQEAPVEATETTETKPAKAANKNPWAQMVPIYLDMALGGDEKYVIAGVNGRVYQVPVGMDIEVPLPISEVLKRMKHSVQELNGVRAQIAKENKENLKLLS